MLIVNPFMILRIFQLCQLRVCLPFYAFLVSILLIPAAFATSGKIRISVKVQGTALEQPSDYFTTLLVMALEASKAENEEIDIIFSPRDYSQARWINMLQSDKSNFVIWTMTDKEREQQMRPIRTLLSHSL